MGMEAKLQQQAPQTAQPNKPNLTGIPTQMKLDFERRSGLSFDDVRVHYNSDKPAQLQALAYTQGTQVYVGPGQERHLPHELGHVVQQKTQEIPITSFINHIPVNTDAALEREADQAKSSYPRINFVNRPSTSNIVVQRQFFIKYDSKSKIWDVKNIGRPNFPNYIENIKATDATEDELLTKNHLISSADISTNIQNLLLNNLAGKTPSIMTPKDTDAAKGFYALCNMIIPDDNIRFGDKSRMGSDTYESYDSLFHHADYGISNMRLRAIDYATRIANIIANLSGVDIPTLIAYSNEFEFILNASPANIRFGDSGNNQAIKRHFDAPLKMEIDEKDEDIKYEIEKKLIAPTGKQRKSRTVYKIIYNAGNIAKNPFAKRFIEAKKLEKVLTSKYKEGLRITTPKIVKRTSDDSPIVLSSDDKSFKAGSIKQINKSLESVELHIHYEKRKKLSSIPQTVKRNIIIKKGSIKKKKIT